MNDGDVHSRAATPSDQLGEEPCEQHGSAYREAVTARLRDQQFLLHTSPKFMHGRAYDGPEITPTATWRSSEPPRDDHDAPEWLTASEFADDPNVLQAKCRQLASLMRISKKTVLYTGAGISAAVIGQAARSGSNVQGWMGDSLQAKPTFTHVALGFLGKEGVIHDWIQQNHDGLPQKAGFPQEKINEIHGSWYDPANPVVKYDGTLHSRAFPWMREAADTADLVLVLGTSLGGLNADQVATKCAKRSTLPNGSLGTVIINLQQTEQDGRATIRLFERSDAVLKQLIHELGYDQMRVVPPVWQEESRVLVPYDAQGRRISDGEPKMWLDLRNGQEVRITEGHNIQGARQPAYMHIGGKNGRVGYGIVKSRDESRSAFLLQIEGPHGLGVGRGVGMELGIWWLDTAMRGGVAVLPIVNKSPKFEFQ
jgi:NAD-dependent SIR2 family protein deacetylase